MPDPNEPNDDASRTDRSDRLGREEEETSRAREREERLTELTDQSLDLLDQLAEARRRVSGYEELVRELDEREARLRAVLADTRQRIRSTRSLRGLGSAGPAAPVDVVLWTIEPSLDPEWLAAAAKAFSGRPTTVLVPPGGDAPAAPGDGARRISLDSRSVAHAGNLAMASTEAPVVLLVLAGCDAASLEAALADGRFGSAADEAVALAQPALLHPDGRSSLGLEERRALRVRRRPLAPAEPAEPADDAAPVALACVAPEVVLIRREAYERLGPFDEDLLGIHALVEYSLRAAARDLQIVGLPSVSVAVPTRTLPGRPRDRVRDRLVTLAQHRPGELGSALGGEEIYWQLEPPELESFLSALLHRLPELADRREAVGRLVAEAIGLAGRTISGPALDAQLDRIDERLDALEAVPGEAPTPDEDEARAAAEEARGGDPASRLYRAAHRIRAAELAKTALTGALAEARATAERLEREARELVRRELQQARDRARAYEERARHHGAEATEAKQRAYALHEQVAEVRAQLRAAHAERERERQERVDQRDLAAARHRDDLAKVASALGLDCGPDLGSILRHVSVVRETLQDRERWITSLLHEAARGVLGRKLRPYERAFLDERGAAP